MAPYNVPAPRRNSGHGVDVLHHGIAMLFPACQAGQDQQGWVGKMAKVINIHTTSLLLRIALYRVT